MEDKINEIVKIAKMYASDIEDYTDIIEDLRVEGYEDEHFKLYEIIRDLLGKKLEKQIREVFTDSVQIVQKCTDLYDSGNAVARVQPVYSIIAVPAIVFLFLSSFVDIYKNL